MDRDVRLASPRLRSQKVCNGDWGLVAGLVTERCRTHASHDPGSREKKISVLVINLYFGSLNGIWKQLVGRKRGSGDFNST